MKCKYFIFLCLFLLSACNSQKYLTKKDFESFELIKNVKASDLDCYCHTQGIAWCEDTEQFVITCQGFD